MKKFYPYFLVLILFLTGTVIAQSTRTISVDTLTPNNPVGTSVDIQTGLTVNNSVTIIDDVLDEDNLVSDSATAIATQQSIKAYVDTKTPTLTQNSVPFADVNGNLTEDAVNFTFNDTTDTLGITGILNVDNLRLDGNTLSSTDANGNITLTPDGTGVLQVSSDLLMTGTGQIDVPSGTTAQRSGTPDTGMFRFNTDLSQFEGYDGTAWGAIGGGGAGSPEIYYIEDFETVKASDFTCDTNFTVSDDSSTPLYGLNSLVVAQGATPPSVGAKCTGPNIAVPLGSRGKTHIVKIPSVNGMNDDDLAVNVYDVTNATELGQISLQATTEADQQQLIFKTESTTANIRLEFEVLVQNASASAEFDNIYFQDALDPLSVYASSEFSSCNVTTSWDGQFGSEQSYCRRDGDSMEIYFTAELNAVPSSTFGITAVDGNSFDTSKISGAVNNQVIVGTGLANDQGTQYYTGQASLGTGGSINIYSQGDTTVWRQDSTVPFSWASGDDIYLHVTVPIAGWSDKENYVAVKGSTVNDIANTNDFKFFYDQSAGTVVDQFNNSYSVVVSGGSSETKTIDISSLALSNKMLCSSGPVNFHTVQYAPSSTNTSIVVNQFIPNTGVGADDDFTIDCTRFNSDYVSESDRTIIFPDGLTEVITGKASSSSSETFTDSVDVSTNTSVTLPAGTWRLEYSANVNMRISGTATRVKCTANLILRDTTNGVYLTDSAARTTMDLPDNTYSYQNVVSRTKTDNFTVTSPTTVELFFEKNESGAATSCGLSTNEGNTLFGVTTNETMIRATRII